MSNFLGEVYVPRRPTSILSGTELLAREGMNLQKGMNFRKSGEILSVFLVLHSHEGEYKDEWHPKTEIYVYEGHDSTTIETGGKSKDQLLMYGDDKLTDNGRFYKAAHEFRDGVRREPLQIQVYEKLDSGIWFDKGIFNLMHARAVTEAGRKVFKFELRPSDIERRDRDMRSFDERMMSVSEKVEVWKQEKGRCSECGLETGLRFVQDAGTVKIWRLQCAVHRGEGGGLLG